MTAIVRTVRLTAAESFWYVLGCIGFGAMYFAKVPVKKAFSEAGLAQMTSAEQFWYVLMCIGFGVGYFAKLPVKKALSETAPAPADSFQPAPAIGYQADYGRPAKAPRYAPQQDGYGQPQERGYREQSWDAALPPGEPQSGRRPLPAAWPEEPPAGRRAGRHQGPRQQG
ncbi:MAG: hypothetical protein ACHP9Z_08930 [Streptosporangiales bacterium]